MRSPTERQQQILEMVKGYSYNAMEICRALNDIPPQQFLGCYFKFDINRRGDRCRAKDRGCKFCSSSIDSSLRGMQRKGMIRSILLRWFDGRSAGAAKNALPTDLFRFYYLTKQGLAVKLMADIKKYLMAGA